jgi:hypothetical protein
MYLLEARPLALNGAINIGRSQTFCDRLMKVLLQAVAAINCNTAPARADIQVIDFIG